MKFYLLKYLIDTYIARHSLAHGVVVDRDARHRLTWRESDAKYKARGRSKAVRHDPEWDAETEEMNRNKVGRPFKFSHGMMAFVAITRALLDISYRELEGYLDGSWGHEHDIPEFTTIWKRIGRAMPRFEAGDVSGTTHGRVLRLVVDATGIALHNRGEWIRERWNVRRGFLKLHLLIDLDTRRIVSFSLTGMNGGDAGQLPELLGRALKRYTGESIPLTCQLAEMVDAASVNMESTPADRHQKLLDDWICRDGDAPEPEPPDGNGDGGASGDGAKDLKEMVDEELQNMCWRMRRMGITMEVRGDGGYDARKIFSLLARLGIIPIIRVRIDASTRSDGVDRARALAVLEQLGGRGGCTNRALARMMKDERLANQKDWKERVRYGLRWIVEIVISAFKRIFGESVRALTPGTTYVEIATKVAAYNRNLDIGDEAVWRMRRGRKPPGVPRWQALLREAAA